jgi:hypothetical protein
VPYHGGATAPQNIYVFDQSEEKKGQ